MDLRVLQVMAGAEQGGAELFFERLCIAMHKAGVHQHVVMREASARLERMRDAGLQPILMRFGGLLDFSTRKSLKREIAKFQPKVVLTWMNRATSYGPTGDHVLCARLGGFYDIKYYKHCDWLVCNTEDIRQHVIAAGFPEERTVHLPNFVPEKRMEPVHRKLYYTPDNAPLIFALGRLHENKAFDTLLKALVLVPGCYLWLAGDGPLRGALEKQAQDLGIKPRVRFLGWRDDAPALFAASDLVVFPSRHEPLGNVALEAWAQCTPMVSTATHGPSKLVTDGSNGLLVPIDDHKAMAEAIRRAFTEPGLMESMARKGWETFQSGYTEQKVVGQYREFFERVVAEKAAKKAAKG
ncbi:glycosyltransferase [Rhodospirillum sp. A1_3_36]|uniref:glycosyltransferase n=1 Tax=Rhodospirillum sp. A1_3_36 TaxID=3391666 RepID=UPI0039A6CBF6